MQTQPTATGMNTIARSAGLFYLVIIICGIWGEGVVRAPMLESDEPAVIFANISAASGLFAISIMTDLIMALSDAALAVLLFIVLRPAGQMIALIATVFRLVQTGTIAANLLNPLGALLLATGSTTFAGMEPEALHSGVHYLMTLHAYGYDVGLMFFAISCLAQSVLVIHAQNMPTPLGLMMGAAGLVYLLGGTIRILAPEMIGTLQIAYIVPLLSETAFCLWLLLRAPSRLKQA